MLRQDDVAAVETTRIVKAGQAAVEARTAALARAGLMDCPRDEGLDRITQLATRVLAAPISLLTVIDSERQFFVSAQGLPEPLNTERQRPVETAYCFFTIESGAAVVVSDASVNPLTAPIGEWRNGFMSYLSTPIKDANGCTFASLCVADKRARVWTARELETLSALGDLLMQEIENRTIARALLDSERLLAAEVFGMRRLHDLQARLAGKLTRAEALDEVLRAAVEIAGADRGCIQLVSSDESGLDIVAHRGFAEDSPFIAHFRHVESSGPVAKAVIRRSAYALDNLECGEGPSAAEIALANAEGIRAVMFTPIHNNRDDLLGVVSVLYREPRVQTESERRLADMLAWTAAEFLERLRNEERVSLLMREVNHRSKNMLAIVQSVALQTVAHSPQDFLQRFQSRLQAIASSQDLLVQNDWTDVQLLELVRAQLSFLGDLTEGRVAIDGPALAIKATAAQMLSMAVHELAANASKYGALAQTTGRVAIAWRRDRDGEEDRLILSWAESGGPPVAPPLHHGFGYKLLTTIIPASFGAEVDYRLEPGGARWTLSAPARRLIGAVPDA